MVILVSVVQSAVEQLNHTRAHQRTLNILEETIAAHSVIKSPREVWSDPVNNMTRCALLLPEAHRIMSQEFGLKVLDADSGQRLHIQYCHYGIDDP